MWPTHGGFFSPALWRTFLDRKVSDAWFFKTYNNWKINYNDIIDSNSDKNDDDNSVINSTNSYNNNDSDKNSNIISDIDINSSRISIVVV